MVRLVKFLITKPSDWRRFSGHNTTPEPGQTSEPGKLHLNLNGWTRQDKRRQDEGIKQTPLFLPVLLREKERKKDHSRLF